jgi:Ribonuclease G/E
VHAVGGGQKPVAGRSLASERLERQWRRAKRNAVQLSHTSMEQADAAWKVIRRSWKKAVDRSILATNKLARRVAAATSPARPPKARRRAA